MQGKLQALSIQTYALFDKKGKSMVEFTVTDIKKRRALDVFQGKVISLDDVEDLLD
jgi:hypothetical protein